MSDKLDICIENLEQQIRWIEDIHAHKFPGWGHTVNTMRQAIVLLKAQTPHLLTAENFDSQHDLDWSRGIPAWVEYRRDGEWGEYWGDTQDEWAIVRKDMLNAEGYRCWTGYPSQKQRNETPWEQKPPRIA